MNSKREIYWISTQSSKLIEDKIEILRRFQFEVIALDDFASLSRNFSQKRLGTIVISDDFQDSRWRDQLQTLTIHPEYAGVRFLLSLTKVDRDLCDLAAALGFRDIIPIDLKPEQWIRRFIYSSSGQVSALTEASPQLSARLLAAIHVPARISWMTENEFWIETRLTPPIGSQLHLTGGPAAFMGLKKLAFKVLEHHQSHLHFRYSDALLCQWDVSQADQDKKRALVNFLSQQQQRDPYRIYSIIRTKEFRKDILMQLDPQRFHLSIALNKTNMIHEPRYIGPDGIIIEDKMCRGIHRENFRQMMDKLPRDLPIFVIGTETSLDEFSDIPKNHLIQKLNDMPKDLANFLAEKIGPPQSIRTGVTFIPKYHRLSYARIILSARIIHLHPEAIEVSLPYSLGRFSLSSVEAPFLQTSLGRRIHMKVIHSEKREKPAVKAFPYHCEAILTDILEEEKATLAQSLIKYYSAQIEEQGFTSKGSRNVPLETVKELVLPPVPEVKIPVATMPVEPKVDWDLSPKELPPKTLTHSESSLDMSKTLRSIVSFIPRELAIILLTLICFGLLYLFIIKFRAEANEENVPMIRSLRLFKEMHQPKPRSQDPDLQNLPE